MQKSTDKSKRAYRHHDIEFKRRLAMLCGEASASVSAIAREHGINANMLFMWRRQFAVGRTEDSAVLVLVKIATEDVQADMTQSSAHGAGPTKCTGIGAAIEIELSGVFIRLRGAVDEATLRSVLRALRRST